MYHKTVGNLFLKAIYPQATKEPANKGKRTCVKHVRYVTKIHRHVRRSRKMSRNMSVVDVIIGGGKEEFQTRHWEQDKKRGTQKCLACTDGTRGGMQCGVPKCKTFVRERSISKC